MLGRIDEVDKTFWAGTQCLEDMAEASKEVAAAAQVMQALRVAVGMQEKAVTAQGEELKMLRRDQSKIDRAIEAIDSALKVCDCDMRMCRCMDRWMIDLVRPND